MVPESGHTGFRDWDSTTGKFTRFQVNLNDIKKSSRTVGSKRGAGYPLLSGALGATRTHDPLVRNQVLYPLSYEGKAVIQRWLRLVW